MGPNGEQTGQEFASSLERRFFPHFFILPHFIMQTY